MGNAARLQAPRRDAGATPGSDRRASLLARRLMPAVFGLSLAGWLAAVAFMSTVPLKGDEEFYATNAARIASFVTGRGVSLGFLTDRIVAAGWFMPGMSFVLAPLYVVDPDPSLLAIRSYTAVVFLVVWVWAVREVGAAFGRLAAVGMLVFPSLAAMWLVFASGVWGDLPAGLLLAVAAARGYRLGVAMFEQQRLRLPDLVVLELVLAAMVYLRGNMIVVVVALHALLMGLAVISFDWSRLLARAGLLVAGLAVFGLLLAPWSLTASKKLGDSVVATSSAPLSLAITFGDHDELCFGPCRTSYIWREGVLFSRRYGEPRGLSELVVQREMSRHALRDLTFRGYVRQVRENFAAYLSSTGQGPRRSPPFITQFARASTLALSPAVVDRISTAVRVLTLAVYVPFFVALVVANAAVVVRRRHLQALSLLVKALTASLFLQPFLHQSHSRYWTAYAPLMTIAAVGVVQWWRARVTPAAEGAAEPPPEGDWPRRILVAIQTAYVAVAGVVALIVVFV